MHTVRVCAQYVGIYFSAHWCPPCRGFTPALVSFYNSLKRSRAAAAEPELEVVFVSGDRDIGAFRGYFGASGYTCMWVCKAVGVPATVVQWLSAPLPPTSRQHALAGCAL